MPTSKILSSLKAPLLLSLYGMLWIVILTLALKLLPQVIITESVLRDVLILILISILTLVWLTSWYVLARKLRGY